MTIDIDWKNMSIEEAQFLANRLTAAFSITAKCFGTHEIQDVSYLEVVGIYDDELHGTENKSAGHI